MEYGQLTFVEEAGFTKSRRRLWKMLCSCGNETTIVATQAKSGKTKSCGCLRKKGGRKTHGGKHHPLYSTWCNMKARCYNKNHPQFKDYGGRGILVCARWKHDFGAFLADMGEKPFEGATLDRVDNDGGYSPENTRWANRREQRINRRDIWEVTIGSETKLVTDWCKIFGITIGGIHRRLKNGEDIVSALTRPKAKRFQ